LETTVEHAGNGFRVGRSNDSGDVASIFAMSVELKMWLIFWMMFALFSLLWCAQAIWRMHRRIRELESELELDAWLMAQSNPPDPEDWWKQ